MGREISGTWHCINCGYTAKGTEWNTHIIKTFQKFMREGAFYLCPQCKTETELYRGNGKGPKKILGTWHCANCGFTTSGEVWNTKMIRSFQKFGDVGTIYRCPQCNEDTELYRGKGRGGGKKIYGYWHCVNCGYTADGKTWNGLIVKTFRKFGHKGAIYSCPECNKHVELDRGSGTVLMTKNLAEKAPVKIKTVFFSHSTRDFKTYNIPEIAERLTKYFDIKDAIFWEEDAGHNIIDFMDKTLGVCNVAVLFCSANALASESVKKEWTAIESLNKPIIPVYTDPEHIPPLLAPRQRILFDRTKFDKFIDELHELIQKIVEE
ncbi:MAG: TIR domain-containing protein [Candidatus Lokiarchaeota archaeon]|nr:TIR domain-containing protein [Candidatus Lokiarchaeota archaeon]